MGAAVNEAVAVCGEALAIVYEYRITEVVDHIVVDPSLIMHINGWRQMCV